MFDSINGPTGLNNKYARISAIDTASRTITYKVNSTGFPTYVSSGLIALLTNITTVKIGISNASVAEVWNSIGRDNTQNKPINESIFVVNNVLNSVNSETIKRTVRFLIEPESLGRSFQFSITLVLKQHNDVILSTPPTQPVLAVYTFQ